MITYEDVEKFVFENLSSPIRKGNDAFMSRCPFHPNAKKRLFGVKFTGDGAVYNCHSGSCDAHGNFYQLYSLIKGVSVSEAFREFNKFEPDRIRRQLSGSKENTKEKEEKVLENMDWILDDCVKNPDDGVKHRACWETLQKFRQERRIDSSYPLYVTYKGDYANRIIIPVVEDGHIVYFQGRAISSSQEQKYYGPKSPKSMIVLNKEYFQKDKYIIVTEGLLDAMSVDDHQGTTCMGNSIPEDYITELYKYTNSGIIIALDNDTAGKIKYNKFVKENKYANDVQYFITPKEFMKCKDMNDIKRLYNGNTYDLIVENSFDTFAAQIKMKLGA